MVRKLWIVIFYGFSHQACAQVKVDVHAIDLYRNVVKKLKQKDRKDLNQTFQYKGGPAGIAIFTEYVIDTLNKKDLKKFEKVKVRIMSPPDKNGKSHELKFKDGSNTYLPLPGSAFVRNDTLLLIVPGIFTPALVHRISGDKLTTTYEEYQKRDTIFRSSIFTPYQENLSVPVHTSSFKLSSKKFKPGDMVFGEVSCNTKDYFVLDETFASGYIHKSLRFKYVFKVLIQLAR